VPDIGPVNLGRVLDLPRNDFSQVSLFHVGEFDAEARHVDDDQLSVFSEREMKSLPSGISLRLPSIVLRR
jgi:hypothetical protein